MNPTTLPLPRVAGWFEAWLDAEPGRRDTYNRSDAREQAALRDRVARLQALTGCEMVRALAVVVDQAERFRDALLVVTRQFAPLEAERILAAAGLSLPAPADICESWGGNTFEEAHRGCHKLARRVRKFLCKVETLVAMLNPAPSQQEAA